jgi:hypothetical protein
MEFLIPDPTYVNDFKGQQQFLLDFKEELLARLPGTEIEVDTVDVGHGADLPSVIALIAGGTWALFLSGKPILENIEAWKKLGQSFKEIVLEKRALVDEKGAVLLALLQIEDEFFEGNKCEVKTIAIKGRSPNLLRRYNLETHPEQIYVITLHNQTMGTYLLVVSSRGTLIEKIKLPSLIFYELP